MRLLLARLPLLAVLLAVLLAAISLAVFTLTQHLPGDPAFVAAGGGDASPEMIAHARQRRGLDRPVGVRYLLYMRNALQGDFGRSMVNNKPVSEDLRKFWPASVELALAAIAISALLGVPLGVLSAIRAGRWLDCISSIRCWPGSSRSSATPSVTSSCPPRSCRSSRWP